MKLTEEIRESTWGVVQVPMVSLELDRGLSETSHNRSVSVHVELREACARSGYGLLCRDRNREIFGKEAL